MAKYKVKFGGFAYIEADDQAEAEEKFDDEDFVFCEYGIAAIEEVDEFTVRV
jgi:hypothetical protein